MKLSIVLLLLLSACAERTPAEQARIDRLSWVMGTLPQPSVGNCWAVGGGTYSCTRF